MGAVACEGDLPLGGARALWVPRGKVLGVIAPGNHPQVHQAWLEALALGYHVLVRPSIMDPFTPFRLCRSLLQTGLDPGMISLVPCEHRNCDSVVHAGDLALVFGGPEVCKRYRHNSRVLVRGPGLSKVIVEEQLFQEQPEVQAGLASSIAADGGIRCTNASGVFVQGRATIVLDALDHDLGRWRPGRVGDVQGALPLMPLNRALGILEQLRLLLARHKVGRMPQREVLLADFGDGSAALRSFVFPITQLTKELRQLELPFPCAWVKNWQPRDFPRLRHTLSLSLMTRDEVLLHRAVQEQTIKKILTRGKPTWWSEPGFPHDGFLESHLFCVKGLGS